MSGQAPLEPDHESASAQPSTIGAGIQTQVAAIGSFTFPSEIKVSDTNCAICQEEFNQGMKPEIPIALPGCGHVFGSVCISQWLHTAERDHGCPLCRRELFEGVPERLIDDGDEEDEEDEEDAMPEEWDGGVRITPIDTPFTPTELAEGFALIQELQVQSATSRVNQQPASSSRQSHLNGGLQEYLTETPSQAPAEDGGEMLRQPELIEDLTVAALRSHLVDWPSTERAVDMVRAGQRWSRETVVEDIIEHHRKYFRRVSGQRLSYPEQTRRVYDFVKTAFRLAAQRLRERPPHNDQPLRILYFFLERSLRESATILRDFDLVTLTDLIKAGVISSPRLEVSFLHRTRMSPYVPGDIGYLRGGGGEPRPYMAQWMRAMPLLAAAVQEIAEAERHEPLRIIDIDCEYRWNLDMEALPPVVAPNHMPRAEESTPDSLPFPVMNPTSPLLTSPRPMESESQPSRTTDTQRHPPSIRQDFVTIEENIARLTQAVDRTVATANGLLQSFQPIQDAERRA